MTTKEEKIWLVDIEFTKSKEDGKAEIKVGKWLLKLKWKLDRQA